MSGLAAALDKVFAHSKDVLKSKPENALPEPKDVAKARGSLIRRLPEEGLPLDKVADHVLELCQGLSNSSLASTYYGFVTGGTTPAARLAELLTNLYDQNLGSHLPEQSIAADVEDRALVLLQELLGIESSQWKGRNLTTGATASNTQGLALGRESIINRRLKDGQTVGDLGLLAACRQANVEEIKILSTSPHSSLLKAASILGLGRSCYVDVRRHDQHEEHLEIDFDRLEAELQAPGRACIVAVSCGEVNTGNFATQSEAEMQRVRDLCDKYGAWLHVDGAFGIFARLLQGSGDQYRVLASGARGVDLADSIAGDLHKFLNVPYDSGFVMHRDPDHAALVYTNPNAGYLKTGAVDIPNPLNIRAENSTRFRGFSVYSTLIGFGRQQYVKTLQNQVDLARAIAEYIDDHPVYELLNGKRAGHLTSSYEGIFMIVLFRAKDAALNVRLTSAINAQRKIFVSGTVWQNQPGCRIAVSNWQAGHDDLYVVRGVLDVVASLHS